MRPPALESAVANLHTAGDKLAADESSGANGAENVAKVDCVKGRVRMVCKTLLACSCVQVVADLEAAAKNLNSAAAEHSAAPQKLGAQQAAVANASALADALSATLDEVEREERGKAVADLRAAGEQASGAASAVKQNETPEMEALAGAAAAAADLVGA